MGLAQFDWLEYSVFALTLAVSALTGVYFAFAKGGQGTVDGYLLGGKNMGVFPVSVSLTFSLVSGIALLGIPNETYTFGTHYAGASFAFIIMGLFTAYIILPVFYELQLVSLYEYLEMRFSRSVRKTVSLMFTLYQLLYTPIVVYAPALALSQVSGLSIHTFTVLVSAVCIFYTSIGGLKAVVWTDTLQGGITMLTVVMIAVLGTMDVGGVSAVYQSAVEGDRLELFNMDLDPRIRASFWSVVLGLAVYFIGCCGLNPSSMQRFLALPTMKKAQCSLIFFCLEYYVFLFTIIYVGLIVYAKYKGCDLLSSGKIERPDQLLPYFVLDCNYTFPGLPGLLLAGVVCAALSTMSTSFNTLAGTIYYDFVEPMTRKRTEKEVSFILKVLVLFIGLFCLLLVLLIDKLGAILELAFTSSGLTNGAVIGVLMLGIFTPQANSKGAMSGAIVSTLTMAAIFIGSKSEMNAGNIVYKRKAISINDCGLNITGTNSSLTPVESFGKVFPLLELSPYYYSLFGCLVTIVVGVAVSYATGPTPLDSLDKKLLSPLVHRFLRRYSSVPAKEVELHIMRGSKQTS